MRRLDTWVTLLGPALLVVLVGICSTFVSRSNEIHFLNALAAVAIVVAIYVFVGSSGRALVRPDQLRRGRAPSPPAC